MGTVSAELAAMPGLYIHIPYCKQACNYCDFYFRTETRSQPQFVQALCAELALEVEYLGAAPVTLDSVYLGGGTPSRLPDDDLAQIFKQIRQHYVLANDAEVTLEANPEDISPQRLHIWREMGINRLSIGLQTLQDDLLRWMNRAHTAKEALKAITDAQHADFHDLSVDFIYAIPGLSEAQLEADLRTVAALGIPHLSAYALTVEPRTRLSKEIARGKAAAPDDDAFVRHFDLSSQLLTRLGYEHYEISNYAKPGHRARHNSSYWRGESYLGAGPSAHSYRPGERRLNLPDLHAYTTTLLTGQAPPREFDPLGPAEQINDYLMTRLRTLEGVAWADLRALLPTDPKVFWAKEIAEVLALNWAVASDAGLALTRAGRRVADSVIERFFVLSHQLPERQSS